MIHLLNKRFFYIIILFLTIQYLIDFHFDDSIRLPSTSETDGRVVFDKLAGRKCESFVNWLCSIVMPRYYKVS